MATIALNVGNFVMLRSNSINYLLWLEHILALAKSQDLVEHVLNATSAPPEFEKLIGGASGSIKLEPTPAFL